MKIHDKFVIELSEVIKGYGNDYQVEEPFNFPCDYKFYEISGVAICEESFKKMKPLTEEVDAVLDKIRSEIKDASQGKWYVGRLDGKSEEVLFLDDVLQIIDKHIAERSDKE